MNDTVAPVRESTDLTQLDISINGEPVTIRPIQHNDMVLEAEFINQLSDQAKHYRFLGGVNQLSDKDLSKLCDVDYHDSMAFVAITKKKASAVEIGVVRYCKSDGSNKHEMAIAIADEYRNTDLAKLLFEQLIAYARTHDVKCLYSMELYDNQDLRQLAKQFGMSSMRDPDDARQLIYSLHL